MEPDERPDPLAPLPERPRPGSPPPGPDLSVCASFDGTRHCGTPPSVIVWLGCTRGEHVGPMSYCAAHAAGLGTQIRLGRVQCGVTSPRRAGICGGRVRVFKITSTDGTTVVAFPPPPPPPRWAVDAAGLEP